MSIRDLDNGQIIKIIEKLSDIIIDDLKGKGLISLYLAGTILTKDQTVNSDIDFFGIVESDFDFDNEERLNKFFEKQRLELSKGIEVRFRAIPICSLEGGEQRGVITFLKPELLIRKLPCYRHMWGRKYDFRKDFTVKPLKLKEEALVLMQRIEGSIKELKSGNEKWPYKDFPKIVFELARVEAEKDHGFEFDPSYKTLTEHLKEEESHIVHKAMKLRQANPSREEILLFCNDVEKYINDLKSRVKEWN